MQGGVRKGKEQLILLVSLSWLSVLIANKGMELMAFYIHFYNLGLQSNAYLNICLAECPSGHVILSEGPCLYIVCVGGIS